LKNVFLIVLVFLACSCEQRDSKKQLSTAHLALHQQLHAPPHIAVYPYPIYGKSGDELRAYINANGPFDNSQRRVDAFTRWFIRWHWPFSSQGEPLFDKVRVDYQITVSLPVWKPPDGVSKRLIEEWDSYYQAIVAHEAQHVSFAKDNAQRIPVEIKKAFEKDPGLTVKRANQIAESIIAEIHRLDSEYDRKTRSGFLEGVQLPRQQ